MKYAMIVNRIPDNSLHQFVEIQKFMNIDTLNGIIQGYVPFFSNIKLFHM